MFAARIVKRPLTTLGVIIMLLAAWLTIAFPDRAHSAPAASAVSLKTDDYSKIRMRKTQNYNAKKRQPAIVTFINNNTFPVQVRWIDGNQVIRRPFTVQPNSSVQRKFRTEYLTLSFWRTDTNTHMYVGYKTLVSR